MLNFILGLILGIVLVIVICLVMYKKYMNKLKNSQIDLAKMFNTDFDFKFKDADFED